MFAMRNGMQYYQWRNLDSLMKARYQSLMIGAMDMVLKRSSICMRLGLYETVISIGVGSLFPRGNHCQLGLTVSLVKRHCKAPCQCCRHPLYTTEGLKETASAKARNNNQKHDGMDDGQV